MGVHNTFRITGGAGGVAHRGRGTLVDLGPVELGRLVGDQRLIGVHLDTGGRLETGGAVAGDDDVPDGGQLRQLRCQQRDQGRIDDDDVVLGVVGHVH